MPDPALIPALNEALQRFAQRHRERASAISPELPPLVDALAAFVRGGKRLRPLFAHAGLRASGVTPVSSPDDPYIKALTCLEWLHACALIHDDIMDASHTRRGAPSAHRAFAAAHRAAGWRGDPERYGTASAILLGDLALAWSDETLHSSGLSPSTLAPARALYDTARTELMLGQYLDVIGDAVADTSDEDSLARAQTVAHYKSAKYTVESPLLIGAALGGEVATARTEALAAYGLAIGEAFQLRDDLLGVFGDPALTGKPAGDDLREGKRTPLIAHALAHAAPAQASLIRTHLGDPALAEAPLEELRAAIIATGAPAAMEARISELTRTALTSLKAAKLDEDLRSELIALASAATARSR
jgi:geranylgeranyl diphosphate synthase type I